jgi:hypothetical protein
MALGSTQPLTEMSTRNLRRSVRRADNLTTFMCRLSRNLGASTSWNPKGLSRPVVGFLYLYLIQSKRTRLTSVCDLVPAPKFWAYIFFKVRYRRLSLKLSDNSSFF